MKKVTIIIVVIFLLSRIAALAQVVPMELKESRIQAPLSRSQTVIEGTIIKEKPIYVPSKFDADGGNWYQLYLVKPTAVLQGTVDSSNTYEFLIFMGSYFKLPNGKFATNPNSDNFNAPQNGIFFLSSEINSPDFNEPFPKATHLECIDAIDYSLINRADALKFLKEKFSLKATIFVEPVLEKKSPYKSETLPKQEQIKVIKDTSGNHKSFNGSDFIKSIDLINQNKNSKHEKSTETIDFEFANFGVTGSGPYYFEFEIETIALDSDAFLNTAIFDIHYNYLAFGFNVVQNYHVLVTKDSAYSNSVTSSTYDNPLLDMLDVSGTDFRVRLTIDSTATSWNRTRVTTTPVKMLHFKMLINDCNQDVGITFADTSVISHTNRYTTSAGANPSASIIYTYANYLGSIGGIYCVNPIVPYISQFTPVVFPGAYYPGNPVNLAKMIIVGGNFGPTQLPGANVYFKNAEDGGASYVPLNHYDIQSWSNDSIIITMPSIIDSIPGSPFPGTGYFFVKKSAADTAWNYHANFGDSIVLMPYAIKNFVYPDTVPYYQKIRNGLGSTNHLGGYTFRFGSTIATYTNSLIIPLIEKAINDWVCLTHVNFIAGDTISSDTTAADHICNIHFVNTPPVPGGLAQTTCYLSHCVDTITSTVFYTVKDIDIAILMNPAMVTIGTSWFLDTLLNVGDSLPANKFDLYAVILHELGHASLLKHVNQKELMYYQSFVGPATAIQRKYISNFDVDGGINVVDLSALDHFDSTTCTDIDGHLIELPGDCSIIGGVTEINPNVSSFKMYPNPIQYDLLTIDYELKQDAPVKFIVLDFVGKEVYRFSANRTKGKHSDQLNLDNLSAGIYFIEIIINDIGDTQKLVKIR